MKKWYMDIFQSSTGDSAHSLVCVESPQPRALETEGWLGSGIQIFWDKVSGKSWEGSVVTL